MQYLKKTAAFLIVVAILLTAGRSDGQVSTGALYWRDIPYDAANFTATTGTWTVEQADVNFLRYARSGNTYFVKIAVNDTSNSSATQKLLYQLPSGIRTVGSSPFPGAVVTVAGGTHEVAWVEMTNGTGQIQIRRNGDTDWPSGTNARGVSVNFWFQLQ